MEVESFYGENVFFIELKKATLEALFRL